MQTTVGVCPHCGGQGLLPTSPVTECGCGASRVPWFSASRMRGVPSYRGFEFKVNIAYDTQVLAQLRDQLIDRGVPTLQEFVGRYSSIFPTLQMIGAGPRPNYQRLTDAQTALLGAVSAAPSKMWLDDLSAMGSPDWQSRIERSLAGDRLGKSIIRCRDSVDALAGAMSALVLSWSQDKPTVRYSSNDLEEAAVPRHRDAWIVARTFMGLCLMLLLLVIAGSLFQAAAIVAGTLLLIAAAGVFAAVMSLP